MSEGDPLGEDRAPGEDRVTGEDRAAGDDGLSAADPRAAADAAPAPGPTPRGGPIGRRITVALVGVSVFTLLAVGVLFYGFLGRYVLQRQQEQMMSMAVQVASQFERLDEAPAMSMMQPRGIRQLELLLAVDLQVLPSDSGIAAWQAGSLLAEGGPPRTRGVLSQQLPSTAARLAQQGPASAVLTVQDTGERLLLAAAPVDFTSGPDGVVAITSPVNKIVASRVGLVRVLLLSGVIAVGLALAVGLGLAVWLSRPLRQLSRAARGMAAGSYEEPITGPYPGEVYELAQSLEVMRREVRRSEESLRGFVGSAAHELRTPLTSIEGFSQALLDGTARTEEDRQRASAAIYRESSRLHRLVDALLTLSRFDSREFHPHLVSVDAGDIVREEADRLAEAGLVEAERVQVVSGDARVVTDPDMFRQVVANLLRNAVQYGQDEPVEAHVAAVDGHLVFEVSNAGGTLDPAERTRVFDRFYREGARGVPRGSGWGYRWCGRCARSWGSIEVAEPDGRTTFRVTLPNAGGSSSAVPG